MSDPSSPVRGRRGGVISPHRGLRVLRCTRSRVAAAAGLALALAAVWALAWNPVMALWARGLGVPLEAAGLPDAAALARHELGHGLYLLAPRVQLDAHALTGSMWWAGLIACAVLLLASLLLPRRWLPLLYLLRLTVVLQGSAQVFFWRSAGQFPYDIGGYSQVLLTAGAFVIGLAPMLFGFTLFPLDVPWRRKLGVTLLAMAHLAVFVPVQYLAHALLLHQGSLLWMPLLFWMFGLPLDILVLVALFSWAAGWQSPAGEGAAAGQPEGSDRPAPGPAATSRQGRGGAARATHLAALAVAAVALAAPCSRAQAPRWELGAEFGGSFGQYDRGLGNADAEFVRLRAGRPWREQLQFEVGRAARFGDEGVGVGASFRQHLRRDTRWSAGFSSGTGDVLFPRWRLDLGLDHGLLAQDRLIASIGYMHVQSKAENRVDGFSTGLVFYGPRGWIASGYWRLEHGHPGATTSRAAGLGLMWNHWRKWSVDAGFETGDVSYVLVAPGNALVDFQSRSWRVGASAYLGERWGVAGRYERVDADVYELWSIGGHVFVEW